MQRTWRWTIGGIAAAWIAALATPLAAIETTYGEDPVPDTRCYKGFIDLGYGIDPIPAKTLSQRWHEWRAGRGRPSQTGAYYRPSAPSDPSAPPATANRPRAGQPTDARPSARRPREPFAPERRR